MNQNSTFKYIFFALAALVLFLFFGLFFKRFAMIGGIHSPRTIMGGPLLLGIPVLAMFAIAAFIAAYVYQDAKKARARSLAVGHGGGLRALFYRFDHLPGGSPIGAARLRQVWLCPAERLQQLPLLRRTAESEMPQMRRGRGRRLGSLPALRDAASERKNDRMMPWWDGPDIQPSGRNLAVNSLEPIFSKYFLTLNHKFSKIKKILTYCAIYTIIIT